jgi:hypothetical protein
MGQKHKDVDTLGAGRDEERSPAPRAGSRTGSGIVLAGGLALVASIALAIAPLAVADARTLAQTWAETGLTWPGLLTMGITLMALGAVARLAGRASAPAAAPPLAHMPDPLALQAAAELPRLRGSVQGLHAEVLYLKAELGELRAELSGRAKPDSARETESALLRLGSSIDALSARLTTHLAQVARPAPAQAAPAQPVPAPAPVPARRPDPEPKAAAPSAGAAGTKPAKSPKPARDAGPSWDIPALEDGPVEVNFEGEAGPKHRSGLYAQGPRADGRGAGPDRREPSPAAKPTAGRPLAARNDAEAATEARREPSTRVDDAGEALLDLLPPATPGFGKDAADRLEEKIHLLRGLLTDPEVQRALDTRAR